MKKLLLILLTVNCCFSAQQKTDFNQKSNTNNCYDVIVYESAEKVLMDSLKRYACKKATENVQRSNFRKMRTKDGFDIVIYKPSEKEFSKLINELQTDSSLSKDVLEKQVDDYSFFQILPVYQQSKPFSSCFESQFTPLELSIMQNNLNQVINIIENSTINLNVPLFNGHTALTLASANNQKEIVIYLLSKGALPNIGDGAFGIKPINWTDDNEIKKILIKAMK